MTEWRRVLLGEVATLNRKALGKSWPFSHLRYIDISSVGEGFLEESPTYFELAGAPSRAKRLLSSGDTVLSTVRPNRRSMFYAKDTGADWVVSTGFCTVTANSDVVDPKFLYYCLFTRKFTDYLVAHEKGAAYPAVTADDIANAPILLPPLEQQRAIAATLGALDDKIESNRRAIRSAMALAEALYQRVAALACKKRLGDHSTLVLGGTPSRKRTELWEGGTVPWIASGAANADIVMEPTEFITQAALDGSAAKMMPKGATVLAITGATLGQVALLGISTSGNQSLVGVWGETESTTGWLHFALRASVEELVKSATGAAQQHVNKGNVGDLMVPIPSPDELQAWSEVCVPLIERAIQLSAESRNLSTMRDALLPELLSGRIRPADVEVA